MLKLKKNIFQILLERVNIAINFMVLSYKSFNIGPKYDTKVSSLRNQREERNHGMVLEAGKVGRG